MGPGELGESMQEQEKKGACSVSGATDEAGWVSVFWYELLLFQCPRTCQRPESMLLCRSGLFRPLRSPAYEGTLVCSGVSSKTEDQEEKYLVGVPLVMKKASAWFLVFRGEPGDGVAGW